MTWVWASDKIGKPKQSEGMADLEDELYELKKAKRLTLESVAETFAAAGFATAAFRKAEELKLLLFPFEFHEHNRVNKAYDPEMNGSDAHKLVR